MAIVRTLSLFALTLCLLGAFALPADARSKGTSWARDLQEKLSLLGYDPGPVDGKYGSKTRAAVRQFQGDAEIKVDGKVGPQTRKALDEAIDLGGRKPAQANIGLDVWEDVLTDRLSDGSVTLPSRYAKVTVNKTAPGRYTISINGNVVSTSPGYNALPRISRTFELPGEDAYLFAAATGRKACHLEHTLLVVRKDGTFLPPTAIGNCRELLNGRIQADNLVLSFPPISVPSWRLDETWVYFNGKVEQR